MKSLLTDPWIPVRAKSGVARMVRIAELVDPTDPPLELGCSRPDFNGALAQFLVGVFQLAAPPRNDQQWSATLRQSPSVAEVDAVLAPLAGAFTLEGDTPFMQDAALDGEQLSPRSITALLLESPGDNALVNNTDLFIKRSVVSALSPELAALALLALQTNAPSGGQGHRTSLRGGGPLTTLIWPDKIAGQPDPATLFQKVWFNVLAFRPTAKLPDYGVVLPWTRPCLTSEGGRTILEAWEDTPSDLERACLAYFATPRRIRLLWEGEVDARFCSGFVTQNYGANYPSNAIEHPASPYYRDAAGQWLPLHIAESGFGYRDFSSLCVSAKPDAARRAAAVVAATLGADRGAMLPAGAPAVWAFGFAMDNMKVLAWHEARYPLYSSLDDATRKALSDEAAKLIGAADEAAKLLAQSVRKLGGDAGLALREWRAATSDLFYQLLTRCADAPELEHRLAGRLAWRSRLYRVALQLFEQFAERNVDTQSRLRMVERAAEEFRHLQRKLVKALDSGLDLAQIDTPKETAA